MAEEKKGTNAEYLHSLYKECLEDPDWELPKELRFFLQGNVDWDLLYL